MGQPIKSIMDEVNRQEVVFEGMDQVNEFLQLVTELSNNSRLWVNGGHTPREMFEKFDKPNLRPLPKEPFVMNRSKRGVIRSEEMNPARVVAGKSTKSVAKAE